MADILTLPTLGLIGPLGWPEMLVIALLGVLIFGKRLPEVGKGIGRSIVEFKKGLAGIEEQIDDATHPPQLEKLPQPTPSADATERNNLHANHHTA